MALAVSAAATIDPKPTPEVVVATPAPQAKAKPKEPAFIPRHWHDNAASGYQIPQAQHCRVKRRSIQSDREAKTELQPGRAKSAASKAQSATELRALISATAGDSLRGRLSKFQTRAFGSDNAEAERTLSGISMGGGYSNDTRAARAPRSTSCQGCGARRA